MEGILKGLRVVEGSAFVAAPLGGMTLAQLGAEVIRFDPIGGGLDHGRWPLTHDGKHSLFWAGMNKGKRSIAVDFRKPRGQELLTQLVCAPGEGAGLFSTNFPARGWLSYEARKAQRADRIRLNVSGRRDGGAEDYLIKPFAFGELLARVNALARRPAMAASQTVLKVADLEMDLLARKVQRAGREIDLQPREFGLLEYLMRHAGKTVTRTMLLENVWNFHFDPNTNIVETHISRLRSKVDKGFATPLIETVRGSGYSLRASH